MQQFKTLRVTTLLRLVETTEPQVLHGLGWLDHRPTTQAALAVDMQTQRDSGRFQMV
jgi:hypothetical protein